jgi:hypothetical protein
MLIGTQPSQECSGGPITRTSGDQHFCEIVTFRRPPPHQDLGRAGAAGSRLALDDKGLWPQLGGAITRRTAS